MSLWNAIGKSREEKKTEADRKPLFSYKQPKPETGLPFRALEPEGALAFLSYYMRYLDLLDVDSVQKSFALIHLERSPLS